MRCVLHVCNSSAVTHRHHHHLDCGHVPVVHDGKMKWLLSDGRLEDEDMPEPMCLPESHLHPTACSGQLVCPSSGCAGDSHTPDALQPSTSAHAPSPAGDAFSMQSNALCDNASVSASKTVNAHAAAAAAPCGSLYHSHFPAGDGAHLRADSGPQAGGHHHHHGHQHFDGCGHPLVRHADHIDFLVRAGERCPTPTSVCTCMFRVYACVETSFLFLVDLQVDDRLHHVHDGHCDDHGQLTLLDDDTLSVLRTFTGLRSAAATE
ncbi:MAG: hypothetical protein EOO65_05785 [Methanosarcinales archaeon]|nr:MAG: hypothetical protein EOO65_05785 [Methanosarcinales archaeon]